MPEHHALICGYRVILIATPTRDQVNATFCADLVRLTRRHPDAKFAALLGIYVANLRNSAASMALQMRASHLLFIDSDMRFPADTLERLLAHDKDIVAANYAMRTMPELCVAHKDGQSVSSAGKRGLERVDHVGCGVMLIRTAIFAELPQPWFSTPWWNDTHKGEDVCFCEHADDHGIDVWIDHDLSQVVRHTGSVEL